VNFVERSLSLGGLFFSIGDISTEIATQGGPRLAFVIPLILGYSSEPV
jgi:hypothetical protein